MLAGIRALSTVVLAGVLTVGTGCAEDPPTVDSSGTSSTPQEEGSDSSSPTESSDAKSPVGDDYQPLTAKTFAASMTEAMYGAGTVHMLMTSEEKSIAEFDYRFSATGDTAMHGTAESEEGTVEMMLVDSAFYVREEAERSWMQLPPELADQILARTQSGDPTQLIEVFESGLDEVTYIGSEDIDGDELYGYDVSFSAEYLAKEMDVPTNEVPAISYELYLDGAHLLRKMTISAAGVESVVRLSDWGEPVEIEAPPADQVELFEMPSG